MAVFIERERLITAIHTSKHNNPHSNGIVARTHNHEHQHFLSMVMAQPAADVVEVVRCKDCKHRYVPARCALWYATMNDKEYFVERGEDFYCSYGERRAEQ